MNDRQRRCLLGRCLRCGKQNQKITMPPMGFSVILNRPSRATFALAATASPFLPSKAMRGSVSATSSTSSHVHPIWSTPLTNFAADGLTVCLVSSSGRTTDFTSTTGTVTTSSSPDTASSSTPVRATPSVPIGCPQASPISTCRSTPSVPRRYAKPSAMTKTVPAGLIRALRPRSAKPSAREKPTSASDFHGRSSSAPMR